MTRSEVSERLRRAARAVVENLEERRLLSANPTASLSASLLAFNSISSGYGGSGASPTQVLRLTNTGGSTLSIPSGGITIVNDPSVTTSDAGDFSITNLASVPGSLAPGQSANLDLTFAAQSPGLHSAFLHLQSNDPVNPVDSVALRGLGTTGTGGGNEPSLAAILREYEIPTIVGDGPNDSNAFTSTFYPATPDASSQEVAMPRLVKAGAGPVTIQLLASFGVSNQPSLRFGTYVPGDPTDKSELFTINQPDSQTVDPTAQGATSFDPSSNEFGLYTNFPAFTDNGQQRLSYSEDALNTWDANVPRKIRFFPLENSNGTVVPNAYVFAAEDNNIPFGNIQPYDSNDLVGIIRNVTAAPGAPNGAVLGLTNLSGVPSTTQLAFNRIQNPNPANPSGFTDIVHDTNTLQINNTGNQTLVISGMSLSDTTNWAIVNPPSGSLSVAPGGTADVTIKFIATTDPPHTNNQTNDSQTVNGVSVQAAGGVWDGTLTLTSNDTARPTRLVQLAGYWQYQSENENEPGLQTIINSLYGYGTNISNVQQPDYPNNGTQPTLYGEEVASGLWQAADPTLPVTVRQLDAFHNQFSTGIEPATLTGWYVAGNSGNTSWLFQQQPGESQSLLPTMDGSTTAPAAGAFSTVATFGFNVDSELSQDSLNANDISIGRSGHAIRFYPARDSSGNLLPNQWLMVMDYEGGAYDNSDFQDNAYLVTNMHPLAQAPAPADAQATTAAAGIALQWQPVVDSTLQGYNVYRSASTTGSFVKLNGSPLASPNFLDTTAAPGSKSYYRITAVDSSGESEAANASATAAASNAVTTTLVPTADAYVLDGSPNTNFGSAPDLQAKVSGSGYNHESYLTFNLSSISGNVTSATLNLFGQMETAGADYSVNVLPIAPGSWSESTVTWNTKPADGTPILTSTTVSGTIGQWYALNLTSYVQSALASGQTTISLALEGAGLASSGYADFNSREAASNNPQLSVSTVPIASIPATPGSLTVTGATSGSVSLSWAPSSGATSYVVLRKGPADASYTPVATPSGTSFIDAGLSATTTYSYEVEAANSAGASNPTAPVTATTGAGATAAFVKADTTTQGNWTGVYGADGYSIFDEATSYPVYAQVTTSGQNAYVWESPTSDPRAPQNASGSSARTAACFFSPGGAGTSFTIDVNLTDGNSHQVGLYLLDWDARGRAESVQILDASSGTVLSTQNVSNFSNGTYLVWNLSGHVRITTTCTGGLNAVASGLFFGPPPSTQSATASFVKTDSTTSGTWTGTYGGDGYSVFNEAASLPSYAQVTPVNNMSWTWNASTSDTRAPEDSPSATSRIASCYFSSGGPGTSFGLDVNLTDGKVHQVALYLLDWDARGRAESVQITDATTGAVLSTQSASNFSNGTYLVWNLSGHVKITVTCTDGLNAVASGLFFGPASTASAPAAPTALSATPAASSITLNWNPVSGATGYAILRKGPSSSNFVQIGTSSTASYVDSTAAGGLVYAYQVQATNAAGSSPASAPVFSAVSASAAAAFVKSDSTTQGNWSSAYGSDGYNLFDGPAAMPAYAQVSATGQYAYLWQSPSSDPRALQNSAGSAARTAACFFSPGGVGTSFTLDVNLTDGKVHQVALDLLDWDARGRAESVQITDATSGAILSTQSVSNFVNGNYLTWNLSGHVKITITCNGGLNAVASGLFFAPPQ